MFDYYTMDCSTPENAKFAKTHLKAKNFPEIKYYQLSTDKKDASPKY